MEAATSAFRRRTDLHRAGAVLSRIIAGLNFYLLDHVRIGCDNGSVVRADVDHSRAVNRDVVLLTSQTVNVYWS